MKQLLSARAAYGCCLVAAILGLRSATASESTAPLVLAHRGGEGAVLLLDQRAEKSALMAARHLARTALEALGTAVRIERAQVGAGAPLTAFCFPSSYAARVEHALPSTAQPPVPPADADPSRWYREQSFSVDTIARDNVHGLRLTAETELGLRNGLLTLCAGLYLNTTGDVVVNDFAGEHTPFFRERCVKTDTMRCAMFRLREDQPRVFDYWDPTTTEGVHEFADWLASFRITDTLFRLSSQPDGSTETMMHTLIARLHEWDIRVWAADLPIAAVADRGKCFNSPEYRESRQALVRAILQTYPSLDGLDFHIGHAFSADGCTICTCPTCRDMPGNRAGVYRAFADAYHTATAIKPEIRIRVPYKMFGDATRDIVEHAQEFPNLELFTWLRWGPLVKLEQPGVPITAGHEDGGGGAEAGWWVEDMTWERIREHPRDYESILRHYVVVAKQLGLPSISWEPALQREIEQMYFCYSQLSWTPTIAWSDLARRFVIYSERRADEQLAQAYCQLLELDHEAHLWGVPAYGPGYEQGVRQVIVRPNITAGIMEEVPYYIHRADLQQRIKQFGESLQDLGLLDEDFQTPPPRFDLRWALVQAYRRFARDEVQQLQH